MSKLNKGAIQVWLPTIVGIIIVLLIGGGILAWQYLKTSTEEIRVPEEEVKAPEGGIEDQTTDWQTYRNEKHGYSFRYPSNCRYGPMLPYCKKEPPEKISTECLCFLNGEDPNHVFLQTFTGEKDNLVLANFDINYSDTAFHNPPSNVNFLNWIKEHISSEFEQLPDEINMEIDNIPAIKTYYPQSHQTYSMENIYFMKDNKVFQIGLLNVDDKNNKNLYNQILSTFKLIE